MDNGFGLSKYYFLRVLRDNSICQNIGNKQKSCTVIIISEKRSHLPIVIS